MLAVRRLGRKLHLERGDAAELVAVERGEVPGRRDQVGPHALDRVDKRARALERLRLPAANDMPRGLEARPEAMDHISVRVLGIRAEVRVPALGAVADLPARDIRRALHLQRDLQVDAEVGADGVRFGELCIVGMRLVEDGVLVRLAGALVEARRRGDKVRYVDRLPDLILARLYDLAGELDGGVPDAASPDVNMWVID